MHLQDSSFSQAAIDTIEAWSEHFDTLTSHIACCFARREPRQHAHNYLKGLLAPVARKNCWQLAEFAGDKDPAGFQQFLNQGRWNADELRDALHSYVNEHLGEADAVLVVDETGFLKKGDKSVGVQRQYSGTAGRTENCQIGVFLTYASSKGHTFLDRELYLPRSWTDDPERCQAAHVPEQTKFATKLQQARTMLERALTAGIPAQWVTADALYGGDHRFRGFIESKGLHYVVAVSRDQSI